MAAAFAELPPRCGDAPGRREPCRPLDRRPRARSSQTNVVGTFTHAAGGAGPIGAGLTARRRTLPLPPYLDRRGVRLARATRAISPRRRAYDPRSPYSASKAASDHLVRAWHHTYGLPVLITNCSNNYGPYHFPEKLIPLIIHQGARRASRCRSMATAPTCATGCTSRTMPRRCARCSRTGAPGETYNVGGHAERTNHRGGAGDLRAARRGDRRPTADPMPSRSPSSRTGRGTIGATPSMRPRSRPSWAGSRPSRPSRRGSRGRSTGISTIRTGGRTILDEPRRDQAAGAEGLSRHIRRHGWRRGEVGIELGRVGGPTTW